MSEAPEYKPKTDFSLRQILNHDDLDNEFDNISNSIEQLRENLQKLQRSDDMLANDAVHRDAITNEALTLFRTGAWNWRMGWLPNVGYNTRDIVHEAVSNRLWVAVADQPPALAFTNTLHWVDVTSGPQGAKGDMGAPFGANPVAKNGDYTVVVADTGQAHHVDASAGTANVLLPPVVNAPQPWVLIIVKSDDSPNPVVINPQAGEEIEGSANVSLTKKGDFVTLSPIAADCWAAFFSAGTVGFNLPLSLAVGGTGGTDAPSARLSLGLGTGAVFDVGLLPGNLVQRDGTGSIPGLPAIPDLPVSIANGGTGANNAPDARTNLGLGTAAVRDAGTAAGQVLLLAAANQLPALDGSLLTGIGGGGATGLVRTHIGVQGQQSIPATLISGETMIAFCFKQTDTPFTVTWQGGTIMSGNGAGTEVGNFLMAAVTGPVGSGNLSISTGGGQNFLGALIFG